MRGRQQGDASVAARVHIGTAGWSYKDWHGTVYPPTAGSRFDPLAYLKDYFDVIEVNSTFYHPPRPETAASWVRRVEEREDFRFTVKLWQHFTHDPRELDRTSVDLFQDAIAPLREADRLGAVLCQFPWSFKGDRANARYLRELFDAFGGLPLALEVRHASWDRPEVFEWLTRHGVAFCNIDQPRIGRSLGPTREATAAIGYFRLHGQNRENWFSEEADVEQRYDYLYQPEELERWAEAVEAMQEAVGRVFVVFNNHYRGQAAANALEMMSRLRGGPVRVPPALLHAYPRLEETAGG